MLARLNHSASSFNLGQELMLPLPLPVSLPDLAQLPLVQPIRLPLPAPLGLPPIRTSDSSVQELTRLLPAPELPRLVCSSPETCSSASVHSADGALFLLLLLLLLSLALPSPLRVCTYTFVCAYTRERTPCWTWLRWKGVLVLLCIYLLSWPVSTWAYTPAWTACMPACKLLFALVVRANVLFVAMLVEA